MGLTKTSLNQKLAELEKSITPGWDYAFCVYLDIVPSVQVIV
jgi:hypothetical protein